MSGLDAFEHDTELAKHVNLLGDRGGEIPSDPELETRVVQYPPGTKEAFRAAWEQYRVSQRLDALARQVEALESRVAVLEGRA